MRKQVGITLIALIVTIIVLLILAGISLSLIAGENGILKRATNAVDKNKQAQIAEEVELAMADLKTKYYEEFYVQKTTTDSWIEYAKKKLEESVTTNNGTLKLEGTKVTYTDSQGKVTTGTFDETTGKITMTSSEEGEEENKDFMAIDTKLGTTYITIQINEDINAKQYQYIIDGITYETEAKTYTIENLDPETEHTIKVIAEIEAQEPKESKQITVKTEPRTYLYKSKEEYTQLTGGWEKISKTDDPNTPVSNLFTIEKLDNCVHLEAVGENGKNQSGCAVGIAQRIDLSEYKYMCVIASASMDDYASGMVCEMVLDSDDDILLTNNIPNPDVDTPPTISYLEPAINEMRKWNISEYRGMYSPGIYLQTQYWQGAYGIEADIYEVWLEK